MSDSFYSSQGRITSFPDHNAGLIERLLKEVEYVATLEARPILPTSAFLTRLQMETFHLFHLASIWSRSSSHSHAASSLSLQPTLTVPPAHAPASTSHDEADARLAPTPHPTPTSSKIRAASVQMIFASRVSQEMITPDETRALEEWSGDAVMRALAQFPIAVRRLHGGVRDDG